MKNLYEDICNYENLEKAFTKARKHKTLKPYIIEFEEKLKENLLQLQEELITQTYKPRPLKTFIIRGPKTRKISKSDFRDRVIHHAICNIIEPIFDKTFIYDSYANRIMKGTLKAIERFDEFKRKVSKNNTINCFILKADIRHYFEQAKKKTGLRMEDLPVVVKGVRGTSNKDHSCEYLGKGLLRAKHNLHVNKDGTIRYDMTEMPITHFRPGEIGTSVAKIRDLGYEKDIHGNALEREDQLIEIFPHDIILPACPESPDEKADDVFMNVAHFLDDEFEKLYGMPRFFNVRKREDLIGALMGCMSPHTSATVVARLIGFSKVQALLASPYIHAAMRRDCDGDEAAVMFLMDLLLNFSRKFIPSHRGGTQDAPLVLNMRIRANEVDDMIFDVDVSDKIPLALYKAANEKKHPSEVKMEQVKARLGTDKEFTELHFSYDTKDINSGPLCSSYKTLPTMQDKVDGMMNLCNKIRAVDARDVSRLIIERHFIRDTRGNLRKFSQQGFRCVNCNEKFRRPPLTGKCTRCGGKIIFTISEGSILKYMQPALNLARAYKVEPYLLESLELTEMYIQSIFGKESEKQEALGKWF